MKKKCRGGGVEVILFVPASKRPRGSTQPKPHSGDFDTTGRLVSLLMGQSRKVSPHRDAPCYATGTIRRDSSRRSFESHSQRRTNEMKGRETIDETVMQLVGTSNGMLSEHAEVRCWRTECACHAEGSCLCGLRRVESGRKGECRSFVPKAAPSGEEGAE